MIGFNNIIGQQKLKDYLRQTVRSERVSHTQMFLGSPGYGTLPMAIAFIRFLLCLDKQEDDACGVCDSCQKIKKLIHPDVHFIFPTVRTKSMKSAPKSADFMHEWRKALSENPYLNDKEWFRYSGEEDKQGNITAADCNSIIHKFNIQSSESEFKVLLLWMPAYLKKEGNILLKLLEEPPEGSIFVLIAESETDVLPTITSRSQVLRFSRIDEQAIIEALVNKKNLSHSDAADIALAAEGDYAEALRMLETSNESKPSGFLNWLRLCKEMKKPGYHDKLIELNKFIDQVNSWGREEQKNFLQTGLGYMRKMLPGKNDGFIPPELRFEPEKIQAINELINKNYYFIERNANGRILFFNLSLDIERILN